MIAISFRTRLRNHSAPVRIGNGREGNGRGMEAVVKVARGVCGSSFHPSHGDLGQPRAAHPTAVPGAWMELCKVGGGR